MNMNIQSLLVFLYGVRPDRHLEVGRLNRVILLLGEFYIAVTLHTWAMLEGSKLIIYDWQTFANSISIAGVIFASDTNFVLRACSIFKRRGRK